MGDNPVRVDFSRGTRLLSASHSVDPLPRIRNGSPRLALAFSAANNQRVSLPSLNDETSIQLYSKIVKSFRKKPDPAPLLGVPQPNPKTLPDQPKRPSWDEYYLNIASAVSLRGDCVRAQHGAVVVKDHKIVSTGYNGTPSGDPRSCGATGQCPRALDPNSQHAVGNYDLCWATHAESNALLRASWDDLRGATLYITGQPCAGCSKLIASAGIERVVYIGQE